MPEQSVFDDLVAFFDGIPDEVRAEISLLLTVLADDRTIEPEGFSECEQIARGLFISSGRFGRLGDLIKTAGIIDVYFATAPRERFDRKPLRALYAGRLAAIAEARRRWTTLRETQLSPAAISATLTRTTPNPRRGSRSGGARSKSASSDHSQVGL